MKAIIALLLGSIAAGQVLAEPPEDRGRGRGRGAAVSGNAGVQAGSARVSGDVRARSNVSVPAASARATTRGADLTRARTQANFTEPRVRSDVTRARVPATSQTAIRSVESPRRISTDRDSNVTTREFARTDRNWRDGDRRDDDRNWRDHDRNRDRDRDWDDGRRFRRPPITVYRNWDRDRIYTWNNNRYRWYGGTWVIYDSPSVVYTESLPVVGSNIVAEVQAELRRDGYYRGAVDGVLGPRTRDAIADFQDDHGLPVTGRITNSLLRELGIS